MFITGLPRSGTTLLLQALVRAFGFAYLTNFAAARWHYPVLATRLLQTLPLRRSIDFHSEHGRTRGPWAPAEGYSVFNRWFKGSDSDALAASALSEETIAAGRQTVAALEATMGGPFLNKNVKHGVRLTALQRVFPNAVYIATQRDPEAVGRSLLQSRVDRFGSTQQWMSVKPANWRAALDLPPPAQVAEQMAQYTDELMAGHAAVGADRFYFVSYDALCADPKATLEAIRGFLASRSVAVPPRGQVPGSFDASAGPELTAAQAEQLQTAIEARRDRLAPLTPAAPSTEATP